MDTKTARIAEAQRLNSLDDLRDHAETITNSNDHRDLQQIIASVESNNPEQADLLYSGLDTFPREMIPETFDDWLRTTLWSKRK